MAKELIYVNQIKLARAKDIVLGKAKDEGEAETKATFMKILKDEGVDPVKQSTEAIEIVYRKMGGLVRTHEEAVKAEKVAEEIRGKGKGKSKDKEDEVE